MKLLVDTSVWSLAFRRTVQIEHAEVIVLKQALSGADQVFISGLILQELLQGFTGPQNREQLLDRLSTLNFVQSDREDHITAK